MKSRVLTWIISMSLFTSLPAALALMGVAGTAFAQQYERPPRMGAPWRIGVPRHGQTSTPELKQQH